MQVHSKIVVLSEYPIKEQHVGFSILYDLDQFVTRIGIKSIPYVSTSAKSVGKYFGYHKKIHLYNLEPIELCERDVLLIICSTPSFLLSIKDRLKIQQRFSKTAVYFIDGFDSRSLDGFGAQAVQGVDVVFVPIEEMINDFKNTYKKEAFFIPFGIDAVTYAPIQNRNKIEIYSYGRGDDGYHEILKAHYSKPEVDELYQYSTFASSKIYSQYDHRALHWKNLLSSSISLCFEASHVPRFMGRSPILYRWFECLTAGNVIVGTKPKCSAMYDMFDWEYSTIEIEPDKSKVIEQLNSILKDKELILSIQRRNKLEALKGHDWSHRFLDIFKVLDCAVPLELEKRLQALKVLIAK